MVAKITSGSSLYGVLAYNKIKVDEGKGRVIECNKMILTGDDPARLNIPMCMKSFERYLLANRRTKAPIFHVSLNPHPDDRLDEQQLAGIAREYMERMGYGDQP